MQSRRHMAYKPSVFTRENLLGKAHRQSQIFSQVRAEPAPEKAVRAPAGDLAHKFRDKKDQQNIGGSGRPACEDQDRRYRRAAPRGELPARTEALLERVRPYNSKPDRTAPGRTVECTRLLVLARGVRV